jgi:hypothetical protein
MTKIMPTAAQALARRLGVTPPNSLRLKLNCCGRTNSDLRSIG